MDQIILEMKDIDKRFSGVHALKSVNLELKKGEVHALMGENGAGKSTLMKVLCGIHKRDGGTIHLFGQEVNFHTIKPLDVETILAYNGKVKGIVTAEEHFVIGGLGSAVAEVLAGKPGAKFDRVGVEDRFGQSGKPEHLFEEYGLTAENIAAKAKALL